MGKYKILKEHFGYNQFKEGQETLIDAITSGQDVLGIMPTGGGKSLCFQIPGMVFEGVTIVVSPLLSLMKDQVNALQLNNVPTTALHSMLASNEFNHRIEKIKEGKIKIIYVSPERLLNTYFLDTTKRLSIDFVVVDEAHCISQWGSDFRPSYLKINDFIKQLSHRPVIGAFTATATRAVKEDIISVLELREPVVVMTGLDRDNLILSVNKVKDKKKSISEFISNHADESGIIYCNTRKHVDSVYEALLAQNYRVAKYHAGLHKQVRKDSQEDFVSDRVRIMVATNAFGMGIDKSDVRYVIHHNMPKDIESYYQEIGRAGRDGEIAHCVLYYDFEDYRINKFLVENQEYNEEFTYEEKQAVLDKSMERLKRMNTYAFTTECLKSYILKYFGEYTINRCEKCTNCLNEYREEDISEVAKIVISAIMDTNFRYGVTVIGLLLSGSSNQKIFNNRLEDQALYGSLHHLNQKKILAIINELIHQGYLDITNGEYPTLKFTEMTEVFLGDSEQKIIMRIAINQRRQDTHKRTFQTDQYDFALFDQLRQLRMAIARERRIPPYIIHSDKTLREMATKFPTTEEAMLSIHGVGHNKHSQYGESFMKCISDYMKRHGISKSEHDNQVSPGICDSKEQDHPDETETYDKSLYEALRTLRNEIARETNMAHYIVFHNSTLKDMTIKMPITKEELMMIQGIGQARFDLCGDRIIEVIKKHKRRTDDTSIEMTDSRESIVNDGSSVDNKPSEHIDEIEINQIKDPMDESRSGEASHTAKETESSGMNRKKSRLLSRVFKRHRR